MRAISPLPPPGGESGRIADRERQRMEFGGQESITPWREELLEMELGMRWRA